VVEVTDDVAKRGLDAPPPAMLGRVMAAEAAVVSELAPEPVLEIEAVLPAEIEALGELEPDSAIEAEASLRVLLAEHDAASIEATDAQRAQLETAADTLRRLVADTNLAENAEAAH
jgi:hypothetical protein